jgi:hypothetical protein
MSPPTDPYILGVPDCTTAAVAVAGNSKRLQIAKPPEVFSIWRLLSLTTTSSMRSMDEGSVKEVWKYMKSSYAVSSMFGSLGEGTNGFGFEEHVRP